MMQANVTVKGYGATRQETKVATATAGVGVKTRADGGQPRLTLLDPEAGTVGHTPIPYVPPTHASPQAAPKGLKVGKVIMISCLAIAGVTALATYSRTNTASLRHSATHSSEKDAVIDAFGGSTEEEEEEVVVPTISEEMEDTAVDESEQHRESFWPSYTPKNVATSKKSA